MRTGSRTLGVTLLLALLACALSCTALYEYPAEGTEPENNRALCSDGIDNDGDGRIDGLDASCWSVFGLDITRCASTPRVTRPVVVARVPGEPGVWTAPTPAATPFDGLYFKAELDAPAGSDIALSVGDPGINRLVSAFIEPSNFALALFDDEDSTVVEPLTFPGGEGIVEVWVIASPAATDTGVTHVGIRADLSWSSGSQSLYLEEVVPTDLLQAFDRNYTFEVRSLVAPIERPRVLVGGAEFPGAPDGVSTELEFSTREPQPCGRPDPQPALQAGAVTSAVALAGGSDFKCVVLREANPFRAETEGPLKVGRIQGGEWFPVADAPLSLIGHVSLTYDSVENTVRGYAGAGTDHFRVTTQDCENWSVEQMTGPVSARLYRYAMFYDREGRMVEELYWARDGFMQRLQSVERGDFVRDELAKKSFPEDIVDDRFEVQRVGEDIVVALQDIGGMVTLFEAQSDRGLSKIADLVWPSRILRSFDEQQVRVPRFSFHEVDGEIRATALYTGRGTTRSLTPFATTDFACNEACVGSLEIRSNRPDEE